MPSRSVRHVGFVLVGAGVLASALLTALVHREALPGRGNGADAVEHHETTDASPLAVLGAAIGLLLMLVVSLVVVSWIYADFTGHRVSLGPPAAGIQNPPERPVTAQPRLQAVPGKDMAAYRAAQEQLLATYGWVDRPGRIVRIPIDRAIDLLASRGLPARRDPPPREPTPLRSASGRFLPEASTAAGETRGGPEERARAGAGTEQASGSR